MVRGRILAAGLVLLGAGCAMLGPVSRSDRTATIPPGAIPAISEAGGISDSISQALGGSAPQLRAHSLLSGLPLRFEPNQGQGNLNPDDPRARFIARGSGYGLFLGAEGAVLTLESKDHAAQGSATNLDVLEMKLVGANPSGNLTASGRLPGTSNYFIGNNPAKWRTGVPQFAQVRYEDVYPGINLVFYGQQGQLEYDFEVAPGADPSRTELEFRGAKQVQLKNGALVVSTGRRSVQLEAPRLYQEFAGQKHAVEGKFVLRGKNRAGFAVGPYDRSRELIIDPLLNFSTYFGGSGDEHGTSVAIDGSFHIYITGSTTSTDLPAAGVYQTALKGAGPNTYIAKITPPLGSTVATLDFVTYLGGTGQDTPVGIRVDGAGNVFVAGTTTSPDFPTTPLTAYQSTPASAGQHVFVTKLSADASSPLYSTYLSGNGIDIATGMTINPGGRVFVTGTTTSVESSNSDQFPATNLPQALPYQVASKAPGLPQFFVTEVNPSASHIGSITYSTYFGGGAFSTPAPVAVGGGIAVDTNSNIYFTGTTNYSYSGCAGCGTTDFPILNAFEPCLDTAPPATIVNPPTCSSAASASESDAFVAKLNPNVSPGQQLVWSTYLGGTARDWGNAVALDPGAASVYIVGTTNSTDIAANVTSLTTTASFQRCLDTPVNPPAGTACTAPASPAPDDAFVARFSNPAASTSTSSSNVTLSYFSFLGGTGPEAGQAIAVDSGSGALVTGWTQSADFPVLPASSPIQSLFGGVQDAFVARLYTAAVSGQNTTASWSSYFGGTGTDAGTGIALDVNQDTYLAGESNSTDLQVGKPLASTEGGGYKGGFDAFVAQFGTAMSLSIQGALTQGTNQQSIISAGNKATFTYTITNNGPDLANNITVLANLNSAVTGVPLTFDSASVDSGTCAGASTNAIISCSLPSLQAGSTATVTIEVTPTGSPNGGQQSFNGGTVQVMAPGNIVLAQTSVGATMSDFRMTVSPQNQTIAAAGDTANYTVSVAPDPLYTSSITVSCSNLPTGASCRLTPSSISLQTPSAGSATLAITTTARPVTTGAASFLTRSFYAMWLAIPGFFLVGVGGDRRRRRIAGILTLCALITMLVIVPACSHSTQQTPVSGTPAGSYTITVTAASGTDTKSQTVGLFVP